MIVLDTNVVSAFARPERDPRLAAWGAAQQDEDLFITSTTVSEMVFGVMIMPEGRRKSAMDDAVMRALSLFHDRTIDFDTDAAIEYGRFARDRRGAGRPIERADAQIAASCVVNGAVLATRNGKDFESIPGLELIDPWQYEG